MKEIFNWVPWFVELSQKIAENDEDFLAKKARQIPWKEDGGEIPLLQYGDDNIDPFSFIYTLAGYQSARKRIYAGVSEVFGLTSELLFELPRRRLHQGSAKRVLPAHRQAAPGRAAHAF